MVATHQYPFALKQNDESISVVHSKNIIIYIVKCITYRCLSVSGIIVVDVSVVDAVRAREDKRWLMLMLLLVVV